MPFINQAWMAYGVLGGLESGLMALPVGLLIYLLFHRIGMAQGWPSGISIGWAFPVSVLLAGGQDVWNIFYFQFAPLNSYQLLQIQLNAVHDVDSLYMRVLFELLGVAMGIATGWLAMRYVAGRRATQGH
ncbi:hypothetical protein ACYJW8_11085 [Frateuria aurantia]